MSGDLPAHPSNRSRARTQLSLPTSACPLPAPRPCNRPAIRSPFRTHERAFRLSISLRFVFRHSFVVFTCSSPSRGDKNAQPFRGKKSLGDSRALRKRLDLVAQGRRGSARRGLNGFLASVFFLHDGAERWRRARRAGHRGHRLPPPPLRFALFLPPLPMRSRFRARPTRVASRGGPRKS